MRGLLVCACLALVASVVADVPWEMTLPNHSPIIVYEPYSDGTDPSKGWSVWTTEDGFLKEGGSDANGEIRHVTSLNRASFTLDFWGTGITLTGVTNASYEVVLDGGDAEVQTTETTLFSQDNLKLGDHILTLTLTNTSDNRMIGFVDAIIATSSPSAVKSTVYPSYDDNSDIEYTGTWEPIAIPQGVWQSTSEYRASVSLKFSNARAVAIHSPLNWGHWVYSIEVDSHIKLPANDAPFNASDFWLIRDSILYFQDNLDPSKDHTIRMTNLAQNPSNETWWWMTFTSFEVWKVEGADNNNGGSSSGTDSSTSSNSTGGASDSTSGSSQAKSGGGLGAGAYAGITIGVLAGVLIIAAVALFLYRRRRNSRPQYDGDLLGKPTAYTQSTTPQTGHGWTSASAATGQPLAGTEVSQHSTGGGGKGPRPLPSLPTTFNSSASGAPGSTTLSETTTDDRPELRRFTLPPYQERAS